MTATQFLGAFNDNLFKQMLLLLCVQVKLTTDTDYQSVTLASFAVPFVLFSGFAGWLSDRNSKRRIVVLAKVAEIVVMTLGMLVFFFGDPLRGQQVPLLLGVMFLMGTQSAFFGPAENS